MSCHAFTHARVATLQGDGVGLIEDGALVWEGNRIVWLGASAELAACGHRPDTVTDAGGRLLTPGLIDCHTHLVFAGNRVNEFEQRLEGASYSDIAKAGGGIVSSIRAVRAASEDALLAQSLPRARALVADGVTTLEIKSGYGLDVDNELKMLRVARRIGKALGISVRTTFLGAHALPPEFAERADDYIEYVCSEMLPAVVETGLADAVDGFCENIAFSAAQICRVFETARAHDLPVKLHAEQLSNQGGARLVAEFGGLSADHLEYADDSAIQAMAASGSIAVLLPGAFYALRETQHPPIDALRRHGVPMAIATDLNPGTSPLLSLRLAMSMACTLFRLTPTEALRGTTIHAARALGLSDRGDLTPGNRADLVLWNATEPAELSYWIGGGMAASVIAGGRARHFGQ